MWSVRLGPHLYFCDVASSSNRMYMSSMGLVSPPTSALKFAPLGASPTSASRIRPYYRKHMATAMLQCSLNHMWIGNDNGIGNGYAALGCAGHVDSSMCLRSCFRMKPGAGSRPREAVGYWLIEWYTPSVGHQTKSTTTSVFAFDGPLAGALNAESLESKELHNMQKRKVTM
jgi:hypothetical protein